MSGSIHAVQWRCDWCGVVSEEVPLAPSGIVAESRLPDGWRSVGYGTVGNTLRYVELKDVFGSAITHLCPACSARPVGDLLTFLATMSEQVNAS